MFRKLRCPCSQKVICCFIFFWISLFVRKRLVYDFRLFLHILFTGKSD